MVDPNLLDNLVRLPVGTSGIVPRDLYPTLVCFGDPLISRTVEEVDPDNLSASIGKDCILRKITIELTDDKVSKGLSKKLPWLNRHGAANLDPDFKPTTNPTLAQKLDFWHFVQGSAFAF